MAGETTQVQEQGQGKVRKPWSKTKKAVVIGSSIVAGAAAIVGAVFGIRKLLGK